MMAAMAVVVGSLIALHLAKRDGASVVHTARAIACAYVAALAGGYLFEAVPPPAALAAGSWRPKLTHAGRAAYGGLIAAIFAAAVLIRSSRVNRSHRSSIGSRSAAAGSPSPSCAPAAFLAGCDYGLPTARAWAVASARQPGRARSPAAAASCRVVRRACPYIRRNFTEVIGARASRRAGGRGSDRARQTRRHRVRDVSVDLRRGALRDRASAWRPGSRRGAGSVHGAVGVGRDRRRAGHRARAPASARACAGHDRRRRDHGTLMVARRRAPFRPEHRFP